MRTQTIVTMQIRMANLFITIIGAYVGILGIMLSSSSHHRTPANPVHHMWPGITGGVCFMIGSVLATIIQFRASKDSDIDYLARGPFPQKRLAILNAAVGIYFIADAFIG
jgi:hypothetical protein